MVLLRTWRKDEDGTHIVLYQSTTHRAARPAEGWGWGRPVRVHVQAAGFTIAPLLPQYTASGPSQESLVTLVMKADLGGFLSDQHAAGRLLSPLAGLGVRSIMEPVVTSVVALRDRVEQSRFVVRPLSMAAGEEPAAEGAGARAGRMERTSTMLLYRRQPLALAQQLAAQPRPGAEVPVLDVAGGEAGEAAVAAAAVAAAAVAVAAGETSAALTEDEEQDAWAIPGTCHREFWSSPGNCGFKVRAAAGCRLRAPRRPARHCFDRTASCPAPTHPPPLSAQIRGPEYLADRKKVPAAVPMIELVAVDLLELEEPMMHICQHLPSVRCELRPRCRLLMHRPRAADNMSVTHRPPLCWRRRAGTAPRRFCFARSSWCPAARRSAWCAAGRRPWPWGGPPRRA